MVEKTYSVKVNGASAPSVVLVGLGPHARRIYVHYFKANGLRPAVVVELESQRAACEAALKDWGFSDTLLVTVPDDARDADTLPPATVAALDRALAQKRVTHALLSTEPKAHYAYLTYFLARDIHTLTDKPITAPRHVGTDPSATARIQSEFDTLMRLYQLAQLNGTRLDVQCQRRFHPAYLRLRQLVGDLVATHGVPVTYLDVYHCDGMWNMPNELLTRENHPYKYGYGKLYHSGYHFIDLMAWLMQPERWPHHTQPTSAEVYTAPVRPLDHMRMINAQAYERLLGAGGRRLAPYFTKAQRPTFAHFGELDLHGVIQFRHHDDTVCTATLNLMNTGFSRRSWAALPADTYKGNGRVRHERLNLSIGPLANIQVHSYQAREIKERELGHASVGDVEHFDIYIFRNVDLIGGQPVEKITVHDVMGDQTGQGSFIGYNEQARETCLLNFLFGGPRLSDLADHAFTTQLLAGLYASMSARHTGADPRQQLVFERGVASGRGFVDAVERLGEGFGKLPPRPGQQPALRAQNAVPLGE